MAARQEDSTEKIDEWLAKVLRGNVPHYERNERTLCVLRELMNVNLAEDARAKKEIETYKREAEVFAEEARKLSTIWAAGGIAPSQLPPDVQWRLMMLGNVAAILDVENASDTKCAQKLKELQLRKSVLQTNIDATKKELQRVEELMSVREEKLQKARLEAPAEYKKAKERQQQCRKNMHFFIRKQQQYQKKMKEMQVPEVDPTCTHEAITSRFNELEQLEKKLEALKAKLRPYYDLPPNEEAIIYKLRTEKERLHRLEREFKKMLNGHTRPK